MTFDSGFCQEAERCFCDIISKYADAVIIAAMLELARQGRGELLGQTRVDLDRYRYAGGSALSASPPTGVTSDTA